IRAGLLWTSVGARHPNHVHDAHDHEHVHDHGHEHHHHEGPCPEPAHEHAHQDDHPGQAHSHDHDHDHDWAPWRYVVLLVPIMLFLIGLPNKGPQVRAAAAQVDLSQGAA